MRRISTALLLLTACVDGGLTKHNSDPTATITSHQDGDAVAADAPVALRGVVGDPNQSLDSLSVSWIVDGADACPEATPDGDGVVTCTATLDLGGGRVVLEVRDGSGAAASDAVELAVSETGGGLQIDTLLLTPDPARTNDVLTASATFDGVSADALDLTWTWSVDGVEVASGVEDQLDGSAPDAFDKGQTVIATLTADDGEATATGSTNPVVIANTPPTAPVARIDPASPRPGDALVCGVETASDDADADDVTYRVTWTVDGAPFEAEGGDTGAPEGGPETTTWTDDTVPGAAVHAEEAWACVLTPNDGEDDGASAMDAVTVCALGTEETCPGLDCLDILTFDASATSDVYWIDPTGADPFEVHCDMDTHGGGWTLVMKSILDNYDYQASVWTTQDLDNPTDLDLTAAGTAKYASFNAVPFTELRTSDPTVWTTDEVYAFDATQASALDLFTGTGFVVDATANSYFNSRAVPLYQSWGCTEKDRYGINLYDALGCQYERVSGLCDHNGGARFGNRVNRYGCSSCGDLHGQGWAPYSCSNSTTPTTDTGPGPLEAGHTIDELMWVR